MKRVCALTLALLFLSVGCKQQPSKTQSNAPAPAGEPAQRLEAVPESQQQALSQPGPEVQPTPLAATAPAVEAPSPGYKLYTVQEGDKGFYAIARRLYSDPKRAKEIRALNPEVDPRKLKIGQTIKVPEK